MIKLTLKTKMLGSNDVLDNFRNWIPWWF